MPAKHEIDGVRIKAVVFDVGETLVDETRSWAAAAREAGVPELTLFGTLGVLIERGRDHSEVWPLLGVERPASTSVVERSDFYPDAIPALEALRAAGYVLGLAGNQPIQAEHQLAEIGLPVDFVATSANWGVAKPSPEFFKRVIEAAGVPACQIAYVGDRLDNDVLPAAAAGMFSIFIVRGPWGFAHRSRVDAARADLIVNSLAEIPPALGGPTKA